MFNPIQFIVDYNSQKFSVIDFSDTGSIYRDGRTTFTLNIIFRKLLSVTSGLQQHHVICVNTNGIYTANRSARIEVSCTIKKTSISILLENAGVIHIFSDTNVFEPKC